MRVPIKISLMVMLVFLPFCLFGAGRVLTLESYLAGIKKNDPRFSEILLEKTRIGFQKGLFLEHDRLSVAVEGERGFIVGNEESFSSKKLQVTKEWRQTGTRLELGFDADDSMGIKTETRRARLSQSLTKNASGSVARLKEKVALLNEKIILAEALLAYEDYLMERIVFYLDWVLVDFQLKAARKALDDAAKMTAYVERRLGKQIAVEADFLSAKLEEMEKKEEYLRLEGKRAAFLIDLHQYKEWGKVTRPSLRVPFADLGKIKAKEPRRLMALYRHKKELAQINLMISKEALSSDLLASLSFRHLKAARFTEPNRKDIVFGLSWQIPVMQRSEEARVAQSSYALKKAEKSSQVALTRAKKGYLELLEEIKSHQTLVGLAHQRLKHARKLFTAQKERYQKGLLDFTLLAASKNRLERAITWQMTLKVELAKKNVRMLNHTNSLLEF